MREFNDFGVWDCWHLRFWDFQNLDFQVFEIWHFGFDPNQIEAYLNKNGWKLIEDIDYAELGDRYVKPTGRSLGVLDIERMVYAEKI